MVTGTWTYDLYKLVEGKSTLCCRLSRCRLRGSDYGYMKVQEFGKKCGETINGWWHNRDQSLDIYTIENILVLLELTEMRVELKNSTKIILIWVDGSRIIVSFVILNSWAWYPCLYVIKMVLTGVFMVILIFFNNSIPTRASLLYFNSVWETWVKFSNHTSFVFLKTIECKIVVRPKGKTPTEDTSALAMLNVRGILSRHEIYRK